MKLVAKWASNWERREEWEIETIEDLLAKAQEHGDIIIHNPGGTLQDCRITVYDDCLE